MVDATLLSGVELVSLGSVETVNSSRAQFHYQSTERL